jgi:putative transposase
MKFAFVAAKQVAFPVRTMCRVLGISPSGYYAFCKRPAPARTADDAQLAAEIAVAHKQSGGVYGSPRVHKELRAHGRRVSKKRIERLMRERGLQGRQKRRFCRTTDSRHAFPVAPNLLARHFEKQGANEAWVGDVTYIATSEGWLYLAVLLDLFSRRVVGWATSATNDRALALQALEQAIRVRHPPAGLVHHTDRGSPYASDDYRAALTQNGLVASMSRTGDCYDNAVAESFFATLKTEHVDHQQFVSRDHARGSIADYIERFYNTARRHSSLGYVSPIEFELRSQIAALAA